MFEIRMVLVTSANGNRVLRLTHGFRVAFGLIAAVIALGAVTAGSLATAPAILTALSLLALLYDEKWIFDTEAGVATRMIGLLPVHRTREYPLSEAAYFEYGQFAEGSGPRNPAEVTVRRRSFQRHFETLNLVTAQGDRIDIEKRRGRDVGAVKEIAEQLAQYCGLPLRAD